jgi:rare lipoprotein A
LPEEVRQVPPRPGALFVDLGAFSGLTYANLMAARMVSLGARVTTNYNAPRDRAYIVRVGPLATVAEADRMLTRAQGAGVNDAAIVVE